MIELMQGDCLELMKMIPDSSVDMVLCDPPYGVTRNKWDVPLPFPELWTALHRITKPNAAILLFGQEPYSSYQRMSNIKEFRYDWIYRKTVITGYLNANKMPLKAHEIISVFYRKLPTYNPQYTKGKPYTVTRGGYSENYGQQRVNTNKTINDGRRYPIDVITFDNANTIFGKKLKDHPTQKPTALLEYLIKTYTNKGETVLDFTMGAGSTGVACVNTGRSFIGIELMGCWYEVAKKRIGEAQSAPQAQKPNATREDAEQLSLESLYEIINADSV